jgi:ribosomal-protein-alanine N-acetyltransferase
VLLNSINLINFAHYFNKMNLTLLPIGLAENKSNPLYSSDDCQNILGLWDEYYPQIGFNSPWNGYFVLTNDQVVGSCAIIKNENTAEISYMTFKEFEGKGIATLACKKLVEMGLSAEPSIQLMAKTAPEHNASTKILERNGFVYSRVVQDHEIGDAWEWVYSKNK